MDGQSWRNSVSFSVRLSKTEYESLVDSDLNSLSIILEPLQTAEIIGTVDEEGPVTQIGSYKDARYRLGTLSSTIYRASSLDGSGDSVALKLTCPSRDPPPHNSIREAELLKQIKHPHIIPLIASEKLPDSRLLLVFPFVPINLSHFIREHKTLRTEHLQRILRGLLSAMEYLHAQGIIHRDIKPSNILLSSDWDDACLIDFGTAWSPTLSVASESPDHKMTDIGTTSYRAPELLFGNSSYGTALDMWAFGCVVYELLHPQSKPLFDSGDLGSELALISSIFQTLGTPTTETWPEVKGFPDWAKVTFKQFPSRPWSELLPRADDQAVEFLAGLVRYESSERLTASAALRHVFLREEESKTV
ncbi:MAG: hypothetical protein M1814_002670 [Vezdaea aestivalis]|nr:MAG: hypothetical protein M1814_002670 [Vezdaea aestivalis]